MTLEELRALLPGFVAGTLEEDERAHVERELAARGEEGARELRAAGELLAAIGQSVPQRAPAKELKGQLLAAARGPQEKEQEVGASAWHQRALAAGLGALIGGGLVAWLAQGDPRVEGPSPEPVQPQIVSETALPVVEAPGLSEDALALLRDGEAYGLALGANEEHPGLWATVFWTPEARSCYLQVSGLPDAPSVDASYTLWAENRTGQRESVGRGAARNGELTLFAELPFAPEDIRRIELTPSDKPRVPLLTRAVFYRRN